MPFTFSSKDLDQLKFFLRKSQKILVLGHVNPDGDCYGSILAWHHYLQSLEKEHHCFAPGRSDNSFDFLNDFYQIKSNPDHLTYDYDLVILNDLNAWERTTLGDYLQNNENLKIVQVDHHEGLELKIDLSFRDVVSAATCQLLYFLWKAMQVRIDKNMATSLLTGIISDTNNYQTSAVTADTFQASAALQDLGANADFIAKQIKRIDFNKLKFLGEIIQNNLVFNKKRELIIALIPLSLWEKYNLPVSDLDILYQWLLAVKGYKHVVALKEQSIGEIRVSWRSKSEMVETNRISSVFGGGGHAQASSFTLYNYKIIFDENGKYQLKSVRTMM